MTYWKVGFVFGRFASPVHFRSGGKSENSALFSSKPTVVPERCE